MKTSIKKQNLKKDTLTEVLSVYVSVKQKKELIKFIDKHGQSMSDLLRNLIDDFITEEKAAS